MASDNIQAWKQQRLELANHFFNQLDFGAVKNDPQTLEQLVDLLLEIGRDLFENLKDDESAVLWLEKACGLLDGCDLNSLSLDASELRLYLLHTYGISAHLLTHVPGTRTDDHSESSSVNRR